VLQRYNILHLRIYIFSLCAFNLYQHTPLSLYLHYFYMLATIIMTISVFILFIFLVAVFIVYFDYILSIVGLSLCLCISSYSACPKVPWVGGWHYVSMVLIYCLPANTLYILGHVVDRRCDTPIESFVVHSSNIGHRSRVQLRRKSELYS
jgi:hypothetical protein